ncbi:4-(cytidine 5'-diphospho)-2-C-methyl-D-erythritol kinase [Nocardioides sp. TRM66260-LWL]|uniref:4-(cytidine 5'-diphospho)-2-C-methyl-D-erythritol kinase n=1 Tax=Nocardioides sp. TRM66260-LWL TaxID=2874478 RepID=UPI001CC6E724|nr:4-(cytidine 5'-diphospho)-2-C-methyl-D-erythritol kinase [Nocardioides sp. TRM66260-LWL]MBZ5734645.1 4-(cytidine 5'-diphospho)-2-C-methyl-D-erythritol kinase [Nocardioides sp. TRM66260-LWL]
MSAARTERGGRSVTVRAPAKINLHLGVGAPRPDGFHPLVTVYQAVGLYDDVTAVDAGPGEGWSLEATAEERVAVDLAAVPLDDSNLALRAARLLAEHHALPDDRAARITIHKGIPVAGGLAGGSADAAATLVALDRLWDLQTPDDDLLALAARLGSDVPFALLGGTALGTGRGELVEPVVDAGGWWWLVVESDEGLSTPSVYRRFDDLVPAAPAPQRPDALLAALAEGDVAALAAALHNDLAAPALDLRPDLAATVEDGRAAGALAVLLSGSGPTLLLLCSSMRHAHEVHATMVERGHRRLTAVPAPVAGAHVVTY